MKIAVWCILLLKSVLCDILLDKDIWAFLKALSHYYEHEILLRSFALRKEFSSDTLVPIWICYAPVVFSLSRLK